MKRSIASVVAAIGLLMIGSYALAQDKAKPLTNDDVIGMVKAELPEDTIIAAIGSQSTDFDISAQALLKLKKEGVSSRIMDAMMAAASKGRAATATPMTAASAPVITSGAEIPAGTTIAVRTIDEINSATAQEGQTFRASLDEPIVVDNQTVAAKGADVFLKLVAVKQSGKITGAGELTVAVDSVMINGNRIPVNAEGVTSSSGGRGKQSAKVIGAGAAIGAILGGVLGGGKGAAIGAAAGAGAGTGIQVLTKGQKVTIPSETPLSFTLASPVLVVPKGS